MGVRYTPQYESTYMLSWVEPADEKAHWPNNGGAAKLSVDASAHEAAGRVPAAVMEST
jgi:hypothetical protein